MPRQKPQGAPVHANSTKYVHNRHCKTNNLPDAAYEGMYAGMCKRCRQIMTWKKQYGKWKALTQPKVCHACKERTITHPFANACRKCVAENNKCAHCHKPPEEEDRLGAFGATPEEKRAQELETARDMGKLRERDRRRIQRQLRKGDGDSDYEKDDDGKEAARKAVARAAAAEGSEGGSASEEEDDEDEGIGSEGEAEDNAQSSEEGEAAGATQHDAEPGSAPEPSAEAKAIDAMFSHSFPTTALKFVEGPNGEITSSKTEPQTKPKTEQTKKPTPATTQEAEEQPVIVVPARVNLAMEALARAEAAAAAEEEDSDEEL